MEKSDNTVKYIAIGAGVVAVAGALWYFLSSESETEEEVATVAGTTAASSGVLTYEDLMVKLDEEISKLKTEPKLEGSKISQQYILNIFHVLTKYTALAKITEDESSFTKRIALLKEKKETEYEQLRKQCDEY